MCIYVFLCVFLRSGLRQVAINIITIMRIDVITNLQLSLYFNLISTHF